MNFSQQEPTPFHSAGAAAQDSGFDLIADSSAVGVIAVIDSRIQRASPAAERVLGAAPQSLDGSDFAAIFATEEGMRVFCDRVATMIGHGEVVSLEWRARRADGALFWCRFLLLAADAGDEQTLWLIEDITARKEAELDQAHAQEELELQVEAARGELMWSNERLVAELYERSEIEEQRRLAQLYDPLTRLPNRQLLEMRLDDAIRGHQDGGDLLAVLVLELDGLAAVNEAIGSRGADALLGQAAQRLLTQVRASDLVARVGEQSFAVVLGYLREGDDVQLVARKLVEALSAPYSLDGQELAVGAAAGAALFPHDGARAELLLRNAEAATSHAQRRGRGAVQAFEAHMSASALRRLQMETALRRAVDAQEFVVHYQARIDLASRAVLGAEALVRWQHPELGLIEPAEFISIAEETGLIAPMGEIVLRQACAQAMRWQAEGRGAVAISVNLSPREFRGRDLLASVQQALATSGLPPERLAIEITEASFMRDPEAADRAIHGLRALGVRLVLDNFGSGQSSLAWLRRFPVDAIKVDGSFVRAAPECKDDCKIVAAIAGLGHGLGLRVIAEGVETEAQMAAARDCGCDEAQGYAIGHPLPADRFWG